MQGKEKHEDRGSHGHDVERQRDDGPGYELPGDGQGDGSIDLGRSNDGGGAIDDGGMPDTGLPSDRGRSESSPGHLKKAAGVGNARDFAPGRANRT